MTETNSLNSTVGTAKEGTKSLRATVPEGIVAFLDLKAGEKLEWRMDVKDAQKFALVKKAVVTNTNHYPAHSSDPRECARRSWDLELGLWHLCKLLQHEHPKDPEPNWQTPHLCECGIQFGVNRNDEEAKHERNHTNPRDKP